MEGLFFLGGLGAIIVIALLLRLSLTIVLRLVKNGIFGAVLLWVANILGGLIGLSLPITPITAVLTGAFGCPMVVIMGIYYYLF